MTAESIALTSTPLSSSESESESEFSSAANWRTIFIVGLLVVVPYLLYEGSDYWFFGDDWVFLARRAVSDPSTILESHDGHWVSLPALEWRFLFWAFGFDYFPYLVVVVASHVGIVVGLRLVMLRARVHPGVATALSLAFLVFGSGHDNVLLPFQTTLNGAVLFGLVHLLLADSPTPNRRNDMLGLVAGALALMCSGVGIGMVIGVGVAVLISRGLPAALLHTVPLGLLYLLWHTAYGGQTREISAIDLILSSTGRAVHAVFAALTQVGVLGSLLLGLTAFGVVGAWRVDRRGPERNRLSSVTGLLVAGVALFILFSYFRVGDIGVDYVQSQSRYLHVGAMAFIPAVAVAVDHLWRKSPVLGALPLVLIAVGIPGNIGELGGRTRGIPEGALYAVADTEQADTVPGSTSLFGQRFLTMNDVRTLAASAAFPDDSSSDADRGFAEFGVSLRQAVHTTAVAGDCTNGTSWSTVSLQPGDAVEFDGVVVAREQGATRPHIVRFRSLFGSYLVAHGRPVTVELMNSEGSETSLCHFHAFPTIEPGAATVLEHDTGRTVASVPVTLTVPLTEDVTVDWATRVIGDSSATEDDFVPASGTLTIPAGETRAVVVIEVVGDTVAEEDDEVAIHFQNPSTNAAVDQTAFGLGFVIIEDDD